MTEKRNTPLFRKIFYALTAVGVTALCICIGWIYAHRDSPTLTDSSIYSAATPPDAMPTQIFGGLILLRPEQLATTPWVDGFQWPCGSAKGAFMYDAQPFGTMNTYRKGHHTGKDINGIGGKNTDQGEPVRAAARGLVVYSGEPSPDWGNVVVLAHRIPGEHDVVQTLYAHLQERDVRVGQIVSRGDRLGSIGTAGGRYLAHLHFEAIASRCTEAGMPGYHPVGTMNRLDPAALIKKYPAPAFPDYYDDVRRIRVREAAEHTPTAPQVPTDQGVVPVSPRQFL